MWLFFFAPLSLALSTGGGVPGGEGTRWAVGRGGEVGGGAMGWWVGFLGAEARVTKWEKRKKKTKEILKSVGFP